MNKKISIALLILICMLFVSCTAQPKEQDIPHSSTAAASSAVSNAAEKAGSTQTGSTADDTSASSSAVSQTAKTTAKAKGTDRVDKATTSKKTSSKKSTTATKKTTTSSTLTCTVTIECKKILEHMDDLKKGHESLVPDNGIILSTYTVTLENEQSAYDAMKKACRDNNIRITESSSKYSTYIIGFNDIDEKDCGSGSGWLYFVNGSAPNTSSKKYIVKNNDEIVFSYTV